MADLPTKERTLITLIWENGSLTTGDTWEEVEKKVRSSQWGRYDTRAEFRQDMRKRAHVWSGQKIAAHEVKGNVSSEAFLKRLAEAGLFLIAMDDFEGN